MNRVKVLPSGIFTFIFLIVAIVSLFLLYLYWYIEISSGLDEVIKKFDLDPRQVFESQTTLVIVVMSLLVGLILTGLSMTFVYNQKMQQLYRLQNNFINNFTHELKTPVTSLKLYLETFLKHDLSKEDQEKFVNYMLRDVHRLSENITNILELGSIESRHFKGEFEHVDLDSFIQDFYIKNHYLFQELQISVALYDRGHTRVAINTSLFEMLLINLATNALKYNVSDEPALSVSFSRKKKNLLIKFKDNGIGVERSQTKKIFKKFYQIGHSQDMSAKGSGIGLYLVQNIVKSHRGRISVARNDTGKQGGSMFILSLPQQEKSGEQEKLDGK